MHQAILLDPYATDPENQIKEIQLNDDLIELERAISGGGECGSTDAVDLAAGDTMWVDGEGLLSRPSAWIIIEGARQPFAGRGVITGETSDGGTCDPKNVTLDWCRENVSFARTEPGTLPEGF
jgi:hypothetical protein